MRLRPVVGLVLAVQAAASGPPEGKVVRESATWTDLAARLEKRHAHVSLADGSAVSGRVTQITEREIQLAGAANPIAVEDVRSVRYDTVKGRSRARWTVGLALAGIAVSVLLAAKEVGGENGQLFAPLAVGFGAGGAAGGYAIGRVRDKRTVVVTIRR